MPGRQQALVAVNLFVWVAYLYVYSRRCLMLDAECRGGELILVLLAVSFVLSGILLSSLFLFYQDRIRSDLHETVRTLLQTVNVLAILVGATFIYLVYLTWKSQYCPEGSCPLMGDDEKQIISYLNTETIAHYLTLLLAIINFNVIARQKRSLSR